MSIAFSNPWLLLLLPVGLVPFFGNLQKPLVYSSATLLPADPVSSLFDLLQRLAGAGTLALLVVTISGPVKPAHQVERVGQGAQMVLLLDRSRSMDQPFYTADENAPALVAGGRESKGLVARRVLAQFVSGRDSDMFGMVVFSSYPIQVVPLTQKKSAVQAAIKAGAIGRGLAETDLGAGLEGAFHMFQDQVYTGSRVVVLISDGAATLDLTTQSRLRHLVQLNRIALYWIYIRTRNSPGIFQEHGADPDSEIAPQQSLHQFFSELNVPYRAYTAEDPQSLARAIADVDRLQKLPIHYRELVSQQDLSRYFLIVSIVLLGIMVLAKSLEIRVWT